MLHSLFEGTQYNSEAGAKCAVYSRARTKQRRGVIKEIWYVVIPLTSVQTKNKEACVTQVGLASKFDGGITKK